MKALTVFVLFSAFSAMQLQAADRLQVERVTPEKRLDKCLTLLDKIDDANRSTNAEQAARFIKELRKELLRTQLELGESWIEAPPKVAVQVVPVKYQVKDEIFRTRDVWLAVIPLASPDQMWLQTAALSTPKGQHLVYAGLETPTNEKFQILLVSVAQGQYDTPVAIRTTQLKKVDLKILASIIIERTK